MNVVLFVAALFGLGFIEFMRMRSGSKLPEGVNTFTEYLPHWARSHAVAIVVALVLAWFGGALLGTIALAACVWLWFVSPSSKRVKFQKPKELAKLADEDAAQWTRSLGATHEERVRAIETMFTERTATITVCHYGTWQYVGANQRWEDAYYWGYTTRSLAAMDNREREFLRIVELLDSAAGGSDKRYRAWRFGLVWAQGKGSHGQAQWQLGENQTDARTPRHAIDLAIERLNLSVDAIVSGILAHLQELKSQPNLPASTRELVQDASTQLVGGRTAWLRSAELTNTSFASMSDHVLHIGSFADGTPLTYSGDGSLVTIAPPGSGKTQCNVFPNLLSWKGPAVVLDVSGDIYENTSKWRAEHVGPVLKFSPLEPDQSHRYNPLAFVRNEPEFIWEDARLLSEMMIVPSGAQDVFWENEARTVLAAATAYTCLGNPPEKRPMRDVLDIMYGGQAWEDMILGLKTAVEVRVLQQIGNALAEMPEKTRASVLQVARSSLNAWTGERIARVTERADWSPDDLRSGRNPTVYIVVPPNAVESYLSLLRVFIGQHIRMLTGGKVPPRGSAPVLIMLDELPRLKEMPPVDEALNIGRKYGLRLWMFAQSVGQLQNAYKNADGMLGSCAVRVFMNPSGADGIADRLSEEIGYVDALDGSRKKLVEATELAGPSYRDQQIVLGLGTRPAKVRKDFAWQNPELQSRMGALTTVSS